MARDPAPALSSLHWLALPTRQTPARLAQCSCCAPCLDHGGAQNTALEQLIRLENCCKSSIAQHGHPISDMHQFSQIARIEKNRVALRRKIAHKLENLALGSDINAARRII